MSIVTEPLLRRFAALAGEPWFEPLLLAYDQASDADDEWMMDRIVQGLVDTAHARGVELPMAVCYSCKRPKPDILLDDDGCARCSEDRELAREERESRPADEYAQRVVRYLLHGLISRDVK